MIISHKFRFIFLKTRKTAGSAIQVALSDIIGPGDVISSSPLEGVEARNCPEDLRNRFGFYDGHQGHDYIRDKFPEEWGSYYKFTIERHPVEKVLSGFRWAKVSSGRYKEIGLEVKKAAPQALSDFLKSPRVPCDWTKYAEGEQILVDKVIRHENIDGEFQTLCKEIGIPEIKLPTGIKKTARDTETPSEKELDMIRNIFHREIEYFKYIV